MKSIIQKSLAEKLGIPESTLSLMLTGKRSISKDICRKISKQTGLTYEQILDDEPKDVLFAAWQIINQLETFRGEA